MSGDVLERGRSLVLAAFDEARASGRVTWQQMTTAVLKNRLLNSTQRAFSEKNFGVSSMVEFARLFPDDLDVDTRTVPPMVTLKRPERLSTGAMDDVETAVIQKIRPDLWRAIVDYRSDSTYVWDDVLRRARVADRDDPNPVMPTVSEADVAAWRADFADSINRESISRPMQDRLDEWLRNQYGSGFLPTRLRGQWNGYFRQRVLDRLDSFFANQNIATPEDLVVEQAGRVPRRHDSQGHREIERVDSLRAIVQECVAVMSEEELTALRISPAVLLRVSRARL